MSTFGAIDIAASGLGVSKFWMDTIGHNLANVNTVRPAGEEPFRAQLVVAQEVGQPGGVGQGSRVAAVVRQEGDAPIRFDPAHPLADEDGYVTDPVVDMAGQMTDLIVASRSYQMNLRVLEDAREAYQAALRLGQR